MKTFPICLIILLVPYLAQAIISDEYKKPEQDLVRTNNNKITSEFDDHIEDRAAFDEQVRSLRTDAVDNVGHGEVLDVLKPNVSNKEVRKLQKMDAHLLDSEGRRERNKAENTYFNEFEIDYSKEGAVMHREAAKEITAATNKAMMEITETLRKEGIDCKETLKKPEIKDPYHIEIEKTAMKEVSYQPKFCEFLRNEYSCSDELQMRCEEKIEKAAYLKPETNIQYNYDSNSNVLILGSDVGMRVGAGAVFSYHFNFNVENKDLVKVFMINNLRYDDLIVIVLNGHKIYSGYLPDIEKLELRTDRRFGKFYGVQIDDDKDHVISIEHDRYRRFNLNKDLKPFLIDGMNKMNITLGIGGWGAVVMNMKYSIIGCKKWHEEWSETCKLR